MERWQNEQREDVHRMIEEAKAHIDESGFATAADWVPNLIWFNWVERYICDRFQYMLRWEWVDAFAMMDDDTLLVRTKDYARRDLNEH